MNKGLCGRAGDIFDQAITGLSRLKQMFPNIRQTSLKRVSDCYSLAVLLQKFEREGLILTDR